MILPEHRENAKAIMQQVREELEAESFRAAVDAEKARIRNRRGWLKRLLSIRITITFKE